MDEKYTHLLDVEIRAFLHKTAGFYPDDAVTASIEEQRKFYDELCRAFHREYPENVSASDRWITARESSFCVRDYVCTYSSPKAHILFFHGGGFILGGLESHDSICAELCSLTNCPLTAVDYRLAPEFSHPAAFDDCLAAFLRVSAETTLPIILVGDSAGGNLAAAVSHMSRTLKNQPSGQVLIYPALGGDKSRGSYQEHANAPGLTLDDMKFYEEIRADGADLSADLTANPLRDSDFSGLPPTVIFTADCDPLADDGQNYCERVSEAGGRAKWINEQGLVHGYLRARSSAKLATDSFSRIAEAVSMLSKGEWSYD